MYGSENTYGLNVRIPNKNRWMYKFICQYPFTVVFVQILTMILEIGPL